MPQIAIMRTCPNWTPHRASITRMMPEVSGPTDTHSSHVYLFYPACLDRHGDGKKS